MFYPLKKKKFPDMKFLLRALIAILLNILQMVQAQDTTQQVNLSRVNQQDQRAKPYVILISADGFRADMAKKFGANHLLELSKQGAAAEYMRASYPTITFPNHYSIVTGLTRRTMDWWITDFTIGRVDKPIKWPTNNRWQMLTGMEENLYGF